MASIRLAYCSDGTCQAADTASHGTRITISASVGQGGRNIPKDVRTIQSALTQIGTGYFQLDPTKYCERTTAFATTVPGGYHLKGKDGKPAISTDYGQKEHYRMDAIYICSRLGQASLERYTHVMVHELAHFVGPVFTRSDSIHDHSYFHRGDFFELKAKDALRTADAYAAFAAEAKLKRELTRKKF